MPDFSAGTASIKVKPSFLGFVTEVRTELERYDFHLDINIGADTRVAAAEIENLRRAARENATFRVDADTAAAAAKVEALRRQAGRPIPVPLQPHVDQSAANQASGDAQKTAKQMRRELEKALQGLQGAATLNLKVLGIVGATGAIAQLAALTDAVAKASHVIGLLPAVSFGGLAGVGAVATGFSGIPAAFKAATAATADATDAATKHRDALEAIAEAEYQKQDADRSAIKSQASLNDSYREASRSLRDMNDNLVDQKLATEDASLSVQEAAQRLQKVQFDPTADSTTRARALLTYQQAVQRLKEQQEKTEDLKQDTAEANAKGIEGSKQVTDAKQKVVEATHAQERAEQALAKAREDATKGSSAQSKLDEAMAKLSPHAKELVNDIRALGPAWTDVRQASQDALTEGMGPAITKLADTQLPNLRNGLVGINEAINTGLRASLAALARDTNKADFKTALDNTRRGFTNAAQGSEAWTNALTKLTTVGTEFLPGFGSGIDRLATRFDNLIQRTAADGSLRKWLQDGIDATRELAEVAGHVGSSIASVFRAAGDDQSALKRLDELTARMATFLKSATGQSDLKAFFTEARADMDKLGPVLSQLPAILHSVFEGFRTWSGIAMPFLKAAADFLTAHPSLVKNVVVAYLAFKTIGPIFAALRTGIGSFGAGVTRLSGQGESAAAGIRRVLTATNGVAQVAGVGAVQLGRFGSAVQQAGVHAPAIARMQQAYLDAAAGANRFGRTAGTAAAAVSGLRTASTGLVSALGGPWAIAIAAASLGILKFTGDMRNHEERVKAVDASWRNLIVTRNELARSLAASGGGVNDDSISNITDQVRELNDAIEKSAKNRTSWTDTRALFQAPWNDNISKENNIADQYDAARKAIEKLGISESTVAQAIANDGAWNDLKTKLEGMGSGGQFAAKNYQWLRDEMIKARDIARDTTPGFTTLTDAVKTLADVSASGTDRLNAMKTALDVLAGKPLAAQEAMAKYNDQVRATAQLAEEFDRTQGFGDQLVDGTKVNTATANGRKLFDVLNDIRDKTLDAAVAGNDLTPILAKNDEQFQKLADTTGLTKTQIAELAAGLGYLPKDIEILAKLKGASDVTQQLVVIGEELDKNRQGVTIPTKALTAEAIGELKQLGVTVDTVVGKPDEIHVTAQTEQARAALEALIKDPYSVDVKLNFISGSLSPETKAKLHEDISGIAIAGNAGGGFLPTTGPGTKTRDGFLGVLASGMPLARLDGGEGITRRPMAQKYRKELTQINAGTFPKLPGYADGGFVDETPQKARVDDNGNVVYADQAGKGKQSPIGRAGAVATYAQSRDGQPYGGNEDCSGFISELANVAVGLPPNQGRMSTNNEGVWLSALGFQPGSGSAGSFRVGWINDPNMPAGGHTAGTLPNNTNVESGGATSKVMYGGQAIGAGASMFNQHAYLVMDGSGTSGGSDGLSASTNVTGQSTIYPQAALPGRRTDSQLQVLQGKAAVDSANSERNAVYANPASTDQDKLAADIKYQQAQNSLESAQKQGNSDTSAISVQGIFGKAAGILAEGFLGFFGLENSVLSSNNVYNKALNSVVDFYGNNQPGGGYSYTPQNLPSVATTSTTQSSANVNDPSLTTQIPGAGPVTGGSAVNPYLGSIDVNVATPGRGSYAVGDGAARWRPLALQALQREGFSTGQVDIMLAQIQSESGGNPSVIQQVQDVNSGGNEAVGLLQVIPGTFAQYRDPSLPNDRTNPLSNMVAALRYYKSRYGSDLSTMWGQGHGYDNGGIANGIGLMMKQTIRPERVLNPRQTEVFESALPLLESINSSIWSPARINPGALNINTQAAPSNSAPGYAPTINARVANVDDLADLVERQAQMKAIGMSAALI